MVRTVWADFEVFFQFLVEDHLTALRALGPETLWDFSLSGGAGADGLFLNGRFHIGGRRNCRFHRFQAECLFGCICHRRHHACQEDDAEIQWQVTS